MTCPFLIDDARIQRLAATRAGRLSLGGYVYQTAYAVARLAAMLAERPVLDTPDVPVGLRCDWAEDLDERLSDGRVVFTQCKSGPHVMQPARLAEIILGLAPKWIWATERERLRFRIVGPANRLGRGPIAASTILGDPWESIRTAALSTLATDAPTGTDRALWVADGDDHEAFLSAIWERLE